MRISCSQSVLFSGISSAALHVSISISDESVRPGPTARVRYTCNDQIIFSNICICMYRYNFYTKAVIDHLKATTFDNIFQT